MLIKTCWAPNDTNSIFHYYKVFSYQHESKDQVAGLYQKWRQSAGLWTTTTFAQPDRHYWWRGHHIWFGVSARILHLLLRSLAGQFQAQFSICIQKIVVYSTHCIACYFTDDLLLWTLNIIKFWRKKISIFCRQFN